MVVQDEVHRIFQPLIFFWQKIFIKTDENYDAGGTTVDIVQSTGQSTTAVMSQKAVTDAITAAVNSAIATALNTAV